MIFPRCRFLNQLLLKFQEAFEISLIIIFILPLFCSAVVKMKSADIKEKFVEYITNPNNLNNETDRHISSSDKVGKPYRNLAPVFAITDEPDPGGKYCSISLRFKWEKVL